MQIIDAADSIQANIAEGYGRGVNKDCLRFMRIARGSCAELEGRLRVALLSHRMPEKVALALIDQTRRVSYLIGRYASWVERQITDNT